MFPEDYLDALLSLPDMEDYLPKISPNGKWAAWTWFRVGPAGDVFAVPADAAAPPLRLTDTGDHTMLVSWTPDSRAVIVAQDHDGDERVQLFRIDLENPRVMQALTEAAPNYYIQGGQLHPNGKWLVYAANLDTATGEEIEETWLYRHDLETGERLLLARPHKPVRMQPKLNRAGTHILYARIDLHPAGVQTWLVDMDGKEDREILNFGPDVKTFARWLPDGRRALVQVETKTHRKIGVWSLENGEIRWLLDDPARDIEDAFAPYGSQQAVIWQHWQGRVRCSLLDVETGAEILLPEIAGNLIPLAPTPPSPPDSGVSEAVPPQIEGGKGGGWLGFYYASRQPTEIVRFMLNDPRPASFISLTRVWERTPLTPEDFTPAEDFNWRSVDGLAIHGWLYRASTPLSAGASTARGTIIYIHGGPTWHTQDWINPPIQFYAAQGFNVLDINYRGSTGYGLPFREAILEDGWGGREQEDIRTGIEALLDAGIAQAGKVGITGTSYGGYSAWWAITHFPPEIVAAAAPICGMTDLVVDYETTRPDIRPYSEEMMGGSPAQVPERYFERSPIHFVENIRGKLLIVQGAQDPNVTPQNVSAVVEKLAAAAIPYAVLAFEDEGHGIHKTANQRTLFLHLAAFFEGAFVRE